MDQPPLLSEIVDAVANANGVDPTDLDYSLQEHVDTDAIRLLSRQKDSSWSLSFELPDHVVTVTSDRAILVNEVEEEFVANSSANSDY